MEYTKTCPTAYVTYFVIVTVVFIVLYTQSYVVSRPTYGVLNGTTVEENIRDYVIYNSKCRLPKLNPWNGEVISLYKQEPYVKCSDNDLLTFVEKNSTFATLYIDRKVTRQYSKDKISCCYMNVTRDATTKVPDNDLHISKCENFNDKLTFTDTIVVKCKSKKEVYSNVHNAVMVTPEVQRKQEKFANKTEKPMSILVIGIDSISRLNFIRTMPKMHGYLLDNDWIEYKGYNKIGDNTFPNLMAMLTGKNNTDAYDQCNPKVLGKLDDCNFIWNDFRRLGYVTAYAEDEATISTFNYMKKGFRQTPTDYYFRAYSYACDKFLKKKKVDEMDYCTGPEMYGERILNVAKDFTVTFKDFPSLGFFWMNSFSHNKLNAPTRMDTKMLQFFEDLAEAKIFDTTMVMFLSDHGMRFGKVRQTRTGWLEERLPFLYFWVPDSFKAKFPYEYKNLRKNARRLTTPYDVYMSLQDVLVFSGLNYTSKVGTGCPDCRSLFDEIESSRSCEDASIQLHWCTCIGYERVNPGNETVAEVAEFVVEEINRIMSNQSDKTKRCAKYKKQPKILSSNVSSKQNNWYKNDTYYLVILETQPSAVYEATVSISNRSIFTIEGGISRLDYYQSHSACINDAYLKKYCYCN